MEESGFHIVAENVFRYCLYSVRGFVIDVPDYIA